MPAETSLTAGIIVSDYNAVDTFYMYFNCTYKDEKKRKYEFKRIYRAFPNATVFSFVNEDKSIAAKNF